MRWCAFFEIVFIFYFAIESASISVVSASVIRNRRQNQEIITSDFNDVVKAVAGHIQNGQNVVIVEYQESPQNQNFRPPPPPMQFEPQFPPHGFQGFYPQPPHRGRPGYFGSPSEGYPHRHQPFSPQFPESYQNHHRHHEQHNNKRPNFNNNPDDFEKYIFSDDPDKSNLAEEHADMDKKFNVDGYIDNFPVILLNANEIK